jgi:CheY-like chemotaxis protein
VNDLLDSHPQRSSREARTGEEHAWPAGQTPAAGVLVVDDEEMVRQVLSTGLRHHGFTVWSAADGLEALEVYRQHHDAIAVVLLDVKMPRLDGPHTLAALQQAHGSVRCCFMSGHTGGYSDAELLARGAERVFAKPFQLTELAQALNQVVGSV